jgi:hypothetical protein
MPLPRHSTPRINLSWIRYRGPLRNVIIDLLIHGLSGTSTAQTIEKDENVLLTTDKWRWWTW